MAQSGSGISLEREREREWKYQIFFIQNTVSGNCDGFKKEKILKTSGVAEPNYLQYSKKGRWVRYLKKKQVSCIELTIIAPVGSIHQ